jgi:hypothetical protein
MAPLPRSPLIDQRIAAAVAAEHELMIAVLGKVIADERATVEGKLADVKLDLINKMIEILGNIRKAVGVDPIDLPAWPKREPKSVN